MSASQQHRVGQYARHHHHQTSYRLPSDTILVCADEHRRRLGAWVKEFSDLVCSRWSDPLTNLRDTSAEPLVESKMKNSTIDFHECTRSLTVASR
jgi:hypothetical protein